MTNEQFKRLVSALREASFDTLIEKSEQYSGGGDPLHNFKVGAAMTGRTPAQTAWGYMVKHLVALHDMVERNDFSNLDDLLEKCQDSINYICNIWAMANDGRTKINGEHIQVGNIRIDASGVSVDG